MHLLPVGPSSTVAVKVNDGNANSNESSIVVAVNRPPTVDAGPDVSGAEGAAISLDGTVSDPDGNTFTVKWTYTAGAGVDAGATCSFADDTAVDTTITCTDDGRSRRSWRRRTAMAPSRATRPR